MSGAPALCSPCPDDAAAAASSTHLSFLDFFAHTRRSGLTIIQQCDAGSLLEYAEQAHVMEQKLVTGCYLVQAVLLVEYFQRTQQQQQQQHEGGDSRQRAQDFVRSFYLARCQPHGPDGSLTAHQQDEIGWRAIFAVQLHSVIEAPEFPALQSMLLSTCLTTLRTLRRVWHPQHISFFTKVLKYVDSEQLGSAAVAANLRNLKGKTAAIDEALASGLTEQWLEAFQKETHLLRAKRQARVDSPVVSPCALQEYLQHLVQQHEELLPVPAPVPLQDVSALLEFNATLPISGDEEASRSPSTTEAAAASALSALVSEEEQSSTAALPANDEHSSAESEDEEEDEDEPGSTQPPRSKQAATQSNNVPARRAKQKRKRATTSTAAAAATKPTAELACLPAMSGIPVLLLRLGIKSWRQHRKRQEKPEQRHAYDEAMAELMWQLADQLSDGALLQVPEFKRARRGESRKVAATFSSDMAGERQCDLVLRLLEQLEHAAVPE